MSDDLEQRLRALGSRPVAPLAPQRVQAIDEMMVTARHRHHRGGLVVAISAVAAVALLGGGAFAMSGGNRGRTVLAGSETHEPQPTLVHDGTTTTTEHHEPTTTTTTHTEPHTTEPHTTEPHTTEPHSTEPAHTDPAATTSPATEPPHPTTTATKTTEPHHEPPHPTTTSTPNTEPPHPTTTVHEVNHSVPAPTMTLTWERADGNLVFHWTGYSGDGFVKYAIIWLTSDSLSYWPPSPGQIHVTSDNPGNTNGTINAPVLETRHFIVVAIGADNTLLAVSNVVTTQ